MPAPIKKQLDPEANEQFVLNRGFEKCLTLYPMNEWRATVKDIEALNQFVKANRDFARYFYRGATEMNLDSANRLLLPKTLRDFAGIKKDIVLMAYINKIEIWDKEHYDNELAQEPEDFSAIAEQVMGGNAKF